MNSPNIFDFNLNVFAYLLLVVKYKITIRTPDYHIFIKILNKLLTNVVKIIKLYTFFIICHRIFYADFTCIVQKCNNLLLLKPKTTCLIIIVQVLFITVLIANAGFMLTVIKKTYLFVGLIYALIAIRRSVILNVKLSIILIAWPVQRFRYPQSAPQNNYCVIIILYYSLETSQMHLDYVHTLTVNNVASTHKPGLIILEHCLLLLFIVLSYYSYMHILYKVYTILIIFEICYYILNTFPHYRSVNTKGAKTFVPVYVSCVLLGGGHDFCFQNLSERLGRVPYQLT